MLRGKKRAVKASISEVSYDDATILPLDKWAVYVNFQILSENERRVHNEKIYTLVCSPTFAQDPEDETIDKKTIIMGWLNKKEIKDRIQNTIEKINNMHLDNWEDYYKELEREYHVDD